LGATAIDPRGFIFYTDRQYRSEAFPYKRFDPDAIYSWTDATDLRTGEHRLAPMQVAALGSDLHPQEMLLCQPISTGIAAHSQRARALLTALLEVVERDAFMGMWQLRRPPPRIEIDEGLKRDVGPRVAALLDHSELSIDLYDLTTDNGVPVVLCKIGRAAPAACVVGASARLLRSEAIAKAAIEAWHTWAWAMTLERDPAVPADQITDFEHHVRHYFEPDNQVLVAFLDQGERVIARAIGDDGPRSLEELVERLGEHGHGVFSVDLTSPDVADLGFVVFRVLVSEMQPLACGVGNYPLDPRRLRTIAAHWRMCVPKSLNADPHPFP
jgi:ribosomal protein S12 methylthiotransferase accessory factor